jgi:membrane associated rhomboid family serine protease
MRRKIDLRGLLLATAVSLGLSVGAFPILYFDIGPTEILHTLIYFPLCIASGAFYVGITVKCRTDLSISALGFGGALTAILPAYVLTAANSFFVMTVVLAALGAILGCVGGIVYAMWDEAKSLRRNRPSDTPRALPRSRGRKN